MVQQVKAYGQILQFPDGMSESDMADAISSNEHVLNPDYKPPLSSRIDALAKEHLGIDSTAISKVFTPNKSIADQAEASATEGENTAAPQVPGAPVRQSAYNKALLNPQTNVSGTGIKPRIGAAANEDIKGQADQQELELLRTEALNPSESGFTASALNSAGRTIKGAGQIGSDLLGANKDNAITQYGQKLLDNNPLWVKKLEDIRDEPFLAFKEASGNSVPSMGAMVGVAAVGAGIASLAPLTGPAAPIVAAVGTVVQWLGPAAVAALPSYSGIRDAQILKDPKNEADAKSKAIAAIGASAVGAIEVAFGPQQWAIAMLTKEGRAAMARKFASTSIGEAAIKGGVLGAVQEGSEEIVQNPIEQLASYEDPTTKKNLLDTAFGGAMGAIGGSLPGGVTGAASQIAQQSNVDKLKPIADAPTVDDAIAAAHEAVAPKEDVLRTVDPTLADIEALTGVKPNETQTETNNAGQPQAAEVLDIVLPDNSSVKAQWKIVDADQLAASMKEDVNQPRDRTRAASDVQIKSIANAPDYRRLSDSPVMDVGAPVVDQDGRIVAGNGRFAGLSQAYEQGTATEYINQLREDAARKGLSIEGIVKPVLVRQLSEPVDTRKLAIASNSGTTLQMSALEQAKLDAERMKGIENLDVNDLGDIALTPRNLTQLKDSLGSYAGTELGAMVDKGGQLSQEGMRRVRNAMLAKAYGNSPSLEKIVESTDSGMRNVLGALTKSANHIIKTKGDTKALLEAVDTYAQLKATGQPVDNFLAQQDAFSEGLSKDAEGILRFIDTNVRSQKKLTDFFKGNFREVDTTSADMFSSPETPQVSLRSVEAESTSKKVGKVGDKMSAGEVVLTASGREATPFPKLDFDSKGKTTSTVKRVDAWLIDNAIKEAESRGDKFNLLQFRNVNLKNISPSDKDSAEEYLFGEQPAVLKPFTKPIGSTKDARITKLEKHLKDNGYDFTVEPASVRDIDALDSTKKARKELAEKQAKLFKKKVVFVKADGPFKINGVMVPNIADTIFVDIRTDKPFDAIMAHELSHWMEQEKPAVYKEMIKSLKTVIINEAEYAKKYGIEGATKAELIKEIVGDLMGDNFTKQSFWNKVAEANPEAFKEIAAAIIKWLKGIIVKAKANGMGSDQWVKDATKAQDIIAKAVAQYTESETVPVSAEGKPKFNSDKKSVMVDGVGRPTENSLGMPIKNPVNFWRWFGDSKVVDYQGRPKVVYHGSRNSGFSEFNTRGGAFFHENYAVAAGYGSFDEVEFGDNVKGVRGLYEAYLKIDNPKSLDFQGSNNANGPDGVNLIDTVGKARSEGRDGVIAENVEDISDTNFADESVGTVYIVLDSNQIKSTTDNNGDYSSANNDIRFSRAYHGSPHDHNKFYSSKIGTGEGAQAYGYGHYFADSKDVAEFYKDNVKDMQKVKQINEELRSLSRIMNKYETSYRKYSNQEGYDAAKRYDELIAERDSTRVARGKLYEVELAPEQDEYLLWDKPLSEQSDKVKSALGELPVGKVNPDGLDMGGAVIRDNRKGQVKPGSAYPWILVSGDSKFDLTQKDVDRMLADNKGNSTGENIYSRLTSTKGSQKAASEYLHSLGIRGIKYLDAKGEGTYNYVIFDDKDVSITAKFSRAEKELNDYRMEHQSPGREGNAPLSDLTGDGNIYPDDVYGSKAVQYYGTGDDAMDKQSFAKARSYRNKPNSIVEIYRAVPKGVSDKINPGDWVTINKNYAKDHGESYFDGSYDILSKKVKAGDIFTNGDSIHEWGYEPESDAKFSRAPKLYSKLEQALEAANDKVFSTGPQVKLWLQSNAGKLGIKKDEIYWSGIDNWLDAQGKVSKQQVVEFVRNNGVKVDDVTLDDSGIKDVDDVAFMEHDDELGKWVVYSQFIDGDFRTDNKAEAKQLYDRLIKEHANPTKHNDPRLTLPGGSNYKELVVTVPTIEPHNADDSTHFGDTGKGKQIGWLRMNTRDGGLFIEELQSQRAQQGRSKGFAQNDITFTKIIELPEEYEIKPLGDLFIVTIGGKYQLAEPSGRMVEANTPEMARSKAIATLNQKEERRVFDENLKNRIGRIPPAPFVSDANNKATNAYITLLMKKALIEAVSNDHASVSWTTGDQQADRYDLSKQVDTIAYAFSKARDTVTIQATKDNSFVYGKNNLPVAELADNFGKDIAKKITNDEGETNYQTGYKELSGLDLKTGGEWAQSMYGNEQGLNAQGKPSLMSQAANDIFKHVGSGKVESINGQPGFYITPEMKSKDLPLFSKEPERLDLVGARKENVRTPPKETRLRKFQRDYQDSFNRFTVIQDWLKKEGITLSEKADVRGAEERYHSKVANQIEDFYNNVRNPLIEKIAKAGYTMDDVEVFLKMQHAQEANVANRKLTGDPESTANGISDQEAQEYLDEAPKKLADLSNEFRSITEQSKQLRVDNGLLSREESDAYDAAYKHYIPLKGESDAERGTGKGLSVNFKSKRRLGHALRDEHVIENILMDHERAIMEVEKNRVQKHLAMMAAEINMPELISIDQPEKRKVLRNTVAYQVLVKGVGNGVFSTLQEAQMFQKLLPSINKNVSQGDITIDKTNDQRIIASASPMLADNEINVYIDGHAIRMQINDQVAAEAFKKLGEEGFSDLLDAGRTLNNYLSKVYTGYNPEFIITNIIRDFTSGFINLTGEQGIGMALKSMSNYPRMFTDLFKYAITNGKSSTKWIDGYRANGGNTGAAYLSDMERLGKEVATEYASYQGVISNLKQGDTANAARAAGRKVFNVTLKWIYNLNQAGENAMRVSAYKAMLESGKTVNEASKAAKNITVNFNRKGAKKWPSALYLFFNASVQGTAATAHALTKGDHKYQAQALAAGMAAIGYMVASSFGGGSEDDWDEISDYTKERNLLIKNGDGYIKIPIPYGYGFFYSLGRGMADAQRKDELGVLPWHIMTSAISEFTPFNDIVVGSDNEFKSDQVFTGLLPTAMKIAAQPIYNKQLFSGSELMPESSFDKSQPDREKMFRATKGTVYDEMAGALQSLPGVLSVDMSPETLKYLTRTFAGGAGSLVDTTVSAAMLKSEGAELDTQEIPFVRKGYMELGIKDKRAAYYKVREEARTAAEEFNRARRDNDIGKMQTVLKDKKELIALDRYANKLAATIDAARDQQDAVRADEKLSVQEKRLKLKDMEATEAKFYDQYLDVFKAAKIR